MMRLVSAVTFWRRFCVFWGRFLVRAADPGSRPFSGTCFGAIFGTHGAIRICGYFLVAILRFLGQIFGADSTIRGGWGKWVGEKPGDFAM